MSTTVRSHERGLDNSLHLLQTHNILSGPFHTSSDPDTILSGKRHSSILKPISPRQNLILHVSPHLFHSFLLWELLDHVPDSCSLSHRSANAGSHGGALPQKTSRSNLQFFRQHPVRSSEVVTSHSRSALSHPALPGPRSQRFQHARVQILNKVQSHL